MSYYRRIQSLASRSPVREPDAGGLRSTCHEMPEKEEPGEAQGRCAETSKKSSKQRLVINTVHIPGLWPLHRQI